MRAILAWRLPTRTLGLGLGLAMSLVACGAGTTVVDTRDDANALGWT